MGVKSIESNLYFQPYNKEYTVTGTNATLNIEGYIGGQISGGGASNFKYYVVGAKEGELNYYFDGSRSLGTIPILTQFSINNIIYGQGLPLTITSQISSFHINNNQVVIEFGIAIDDKGFGVPTQFLSQQDTLKTNCLVTIKERTYSWTWEFNGVQLSNGQYKTYANSDGNYELMKASHWNSFLKAISQKMSDYGQDRDTTFDTLYNQAWATSKQPITASQYNAAINLLSHTYIRGVTSKKVPAGSYVNPDDPITIKNFNILSEYYSEP